MILDEKVTIKINSRNYNYYKDIIKNIHNNKYYEINTNLLYKGSHLKVNVKCDICNNIYKKPYRQYIQSYKKMNLYCCSPICAQIKNKKTNQLKYGVDNVFQDSDVKEMIKYTNIKKYGVQYPSQSKEIRDKIKSTLLENFGVDNPSKNILIKEKIKNTCIIKYGVENPNQNPLVKKRAKKTRISKGLQIPDDLKRPFDLYRKMVDKITLKNKKQLLESWNGYDYYDNEFIANNFSLSSGDSNYPTIDHKISVRYGFDNKISPEDISIIENLCITKRRINATKGINSIFY